MLISDIFRFALIGLSIALTGFSVGFLMSLFTKIFGKRFQGISLGFTAGLLIAFVCFTLLPESFAGSYFWFGIFGMIAGVLVTAYLEDKIPDSSAIRADAKRSRMYKTGLLFVLAVCLHNIPEGFAIGAMLSTNWESGLRFALAVGIHCIPEGLCYGILLRQGGYTTRQIALITLLISLPITLGSLAGAYASVISPLLPKGVLSFTSGVIMYISCGNILPESRIVWNGRLSTLGALLGFIVGVLLTVKL